MDYQLKASKRTVKNCIPDSGYSCKVDKEKGGFRKTKAYLVACFFLSIFFTKRREML